MSDDERARLEAAGLVAPIVRGMDETTLRRRVHTYDRETGEPVREVTVRQLIGGLAKVTALEVEVIDGKRPKEFLCDGCGRKVPYPKMGAIVKVCSRCRTGGQTVCPCGCSKAPPPGAFSPSMRARRAGGPWLCRAETARRSIAAMTAEQRSDRTRAARNGMTAEQRSENMRRCARKAAAAKTPEQRSAAARKAALACRDSATPEERSARAKVRASKFQASCTTEQLEKRRRMMLHASACRTKEQMDAGKATRAATLAARTPEQKEEWLARSRKATAASLPVIKANAAKRKRAAEAAVLSSEEDGRPQKTDPND